MRYCPFRTRPHSAHQGPGTSSPIQRIPDPSPSGYKGKPETALPSRYGNLLSERAPGTGVRTGSECGMRVRRPVEIEPFGVLKLDFIPVRGSIRQPHRLTFLDLHPGIVDVLLRDTGRSAEDRGAPAKALGSCARGSRCRTAALQQHLLYHAQAQRNLK